MHIIRSSRELFLSFHDSMVFLIAISSRRSTGKASPKNRETAVSIMPLLCCLYCDFMMQPCFPRWLMNTRAENETVQNPPWLNCLAIPFFTNNTPGKRKPSCRHASSLFLLLALALLLQHLLDNLLLLDQERADDAVAHAVAAPRSTVCALDGLLGLGDLGVLAGSQGGNLQVNSG